MTDSEELIYNWFTKRKYEVFRNGWPDFLCYKKGDYGQEYLMAIEVKSGSDTLRPEQKIMHRYLKKAGIPVYVVRPEDLKNARQRGKALMFSAGNVEELRHMVRNETLELHRDLKKLERIEQYIDNVSIAFDKI